MLLCLTGSSVDKFIIRYVKMWYTLGKLYDWHSISPIFSDRSMVHQTAHHRARNQSNLSTLITRCYVHWYLYQPRNNGATSSFTKIPNALNSFPPGQNGRRHIADDTFKYIFMNKNICILSRLSLKFVPEGPIDNKYISIVNWTLRNKFQWKSTIGV